MPNMVIWTTKNETDLDLDRLQALMVAKDYQIDTWGQFEVCF
jgi:hypothetical protein